MGFKAEAEAEKGFAFDPKLCAGNAFGLGMDEVLFCLFSSETWETSSFGARASSVACDTLVRPEVRETGSGARSFSANAIRATARSSYTHVAPFAAALAAATAMASVAVRIAFRLTLLLSASSPSVMTIGTSASNGGS